jgi:predicted glutamine amidotransferase
MNVRSRRFLVHLRRPNKLSTIQYADTQPFFRGSDYAFCHNGFLDRAETLRPSYQDRLAGGADSEVGWCFLQDRLDDGADPLDALREVDETFGGKVNLGYLDRRGALAVYSHNLSNAMWRFTDRGADIVSTALHSDDDSVFTLVYPDSTDRRLVPSGTAVLLGTEEADGPLLATTAAGRPGENR